MDTSTSDSVTLTLSSDAAIVLDALLSRLDDDAATGTASGGFDSGEIAALWELQAALERALVPPFDMDYKRMVAEASARLQSKAGL